MKRVFATFAVVLTSLAAGGTAASAGSSVNLGDLTVDPASGPAGTTFAVSGDGCTWQARPVGGMEKAASDFSVALWFEAGTQSEFADSPAGSWNQEFTVPDGTAPGVYKITAICNYDDGEVSRQVGSYNDGEFTVTEEPTTTTVAPTTTEEPTTTTTEAATTATTQSPATTAAAAAAAEAELPRTGADPTALLTVGGASLSGGLALFAARRRTRSRR